MITCTMIPAANISLILSEFGSTGNERTKSDWTHMGITIDLLFMRIQVLNLSDEFGSVITVVLSPSTESHEFVCCERCSGRTRGDDTAEIGRLLMQNYALPVYP